MPLLQKKLLIIIIICLFFIIGIPRFFSLNAHWSSDEARWLRRSAQFMFAVKKGEFSDTLIAYHPGVTTMWIAGLRAFFVEPGINVPNLTRARWFIGIVVWIGIGIACLLLYKLFGQWVALAGGACLAYSPLFLAQTRRVHTDALASIFILLTVLLFLCYCQNRQHHRYLVLSGISFGLAVLSKSYAFILVAWIPLCLFLLRKPQERRSNRFSSSVAEGLCFLNCIAVTVLALWPVFWTPIWGLMTLCLFGLTLILLKGIKNRRCSIVLMMVVGAGLVLICVQATQTIWHVLDRVNWAVTTPHEVEHFFLGKVVNDPGWLFYPLVLTIKSTPLMLPFVLIGCILLWKQHKHSDENAYQFRIVLALVAGIVLFTVCLSATSKKFSRYLLPAFPMLEILAAIGFVEGLRWIYIWFRFRFGTAATEKSKTTLVVLACIGFFFIQMFPVLARHPYYGTYYNLCWKVTDITKIITVGEASGLDIAANYLDQKPNANRTFVQVSPLATEFVQHYFRGFAYRSDRRMGRIPDYEVVYIRDSQIGRVPQTGTLNGELEVIITLNGIDHVWIYHLPRKEGTP
ncbi:MAG: glycosyltransferase family 39 protein [Candidatus Poribacteria bacterium]|nr:glycosyltransferase family 39 protein [Candidatus Poribacteria bacterium]